MRCPGGRELSTLNFLKEEDHKGVTFYVPMTYDWRFIRHLKSKKEVAIAVPAFPGYIFAVGAGAKWAVFDRHRRLYGVLCYSTKNYKQPCLTPASTITKDYYEPKVTAPKPKVGSKVRINKGPFIDLVGVVCERGVIELNLFGKFVKVKMPIDMFILI